MKDRPLLSHTQVSMLSKCSLQYYLKYILNIKKPQSVQMLVGSAFHKAMAEHFMYKSLTDRNLEYDEVSKIFVSYFDTAIKEGKAELTRTQEPGEFKCAGLSILSYYYSNYARNMHPYILSTVPYDTLCLDELTEESPYSKLVRTLTCSWVDVPAVELKRIVDIPGTNYSFIGYIDLIQDNGTVVDYKIVGKKWAKRESSENKQATAYAFLLDRAVDFQFHVGVRSEAAPVVQLVKCRRDLQDINDYVVYLKECITKIESLKDGSVQPCVSSGYCNERTCSYFQECQAWKFGVPFEELQPAIL